MTAPALDERERDLLADHIQQAFAGVRVQPKLVARTEALFVAELLLSVGYTRAAQRPAAPEAALDAALARLKECRGLCEHGCEGRCNVCPQDAVNDVIREIARFREAQRPTAPIDMVLFCPKCGTQHVDAPEPGTAWTNPPHKSHLCKSCKHIWRPCDQATNGVERINTVGAADSPAQPSRIAALEAVADAARINANNGSPWNLKLLNEALARLGASAEQPLHDGEHEWVSLKNEHVESGEFCLKCYRADPSKLRIRP